MQNYPNDTKHLALNFDEFLAGRALESVHADRLIRVNISRNTLVAIIISLLIHAAIFFFVPKIELDIPLNPASNPLVVNMIVPEKTVSAGEQVQPEQPKTSIQKPVPKVQKPKPIAPKPVPKIINAEPPSFAVPEVLTKPLQKDFNPKPPQESNAKQILPEDFPDMQSYMKAVQAQRQGAELDAARQNAVAAAREQVPTEEQLRDARIKRNMQNGTNGIFEITSLSERHATFAFRGWVNDYSASKRQFFEVEAKPGQDVRLVMIRRMIALIREHYDGDFNWESHRLGRSVVQSARLEDSAGLEDFLMMEFFGTNYKNSS